MTHIDVVAKTPNKKYSLYILALSNGKYYAGITNDIKRRLHEHRTKKKGYCFKYLPILLVYMRIFDTRKEARAEEVKAKNMSPKMYYLRHRFRK